MTFTRRGRLPRTIGAAAALALVLTACGDDGSDSADGGGDSGGSEGSEGGGDSSDPFLIGVYGPGQISQGTDIRDGVQLAVDEVNEAGGIGGRQVETTEFCDTENGARPDLATQCVQGFIQEDRVDAIIGGFSSDEVLATLDTVVAGETLYIDPGAAASAITEGVDATGDRRFIFRIGPVKDTFLAADMCLTYVTKLAPEIGATKVGILFEDVQYNEALIPALAQCISDPAGSALGMALGFPPETPALELVAEPQPFLPDATDFSSQFSAVSEADLVIASVSRAEGVALVAQWAQTQQPFQLGGINVAGQAPGFFDAVGGGNARYFINGPGGTIDAPITENTQSFFGGFTDTFGREPIYTAAPAYDAVKAIAMAAEEAGSTETDAIIEALGNLSFSGAQGETSFDEQHDVVYGAGGAREGINPVYFQFAEDGSKNLIYPKSVEGSQPFEPAPWAPVGG